MSLGLRRQGSAKGQALFTCTFASLPTCPNEQYRKAFLKLSRNLAPSRRGKAFERLEVHDASVPSEPVASFAMETRERLNTALQKIEPDKTLSTEEPVSLRGTLRAVHLDKDWLEIATTDPLLTSASIRIPDYQWPGSAL